MPNYIYRIDPLSEFRKIKDGVFRAKRYYKEGFPHPFLISRLQSAPDGHAIFRVCFYSNIQLTKQSVDSDFALMKPCLIHRIDVEHVLAAGFTHAWDDGFIEGDASMFWILEKLDGANENFSNAGVAMSLFESVVF